ncbi:polysaccharide deacetylase family protein [Methylomarinum sp. Ch1-1]|uniref:Polysaccharide deacetylase family protein n=1 Tax=Methylomarinum roseum TaxID=3067653 RepID=A0AAU7NPK9_9GAMM|nr:polysaccharide deacetylase family protein [Methylomarinum sp. Ch1-1]MDP4521200.1 polysaccharide deacetylase family protein [Methylomarinum sp. Ch1-1]
MPIIDPLSKRLLCGAGHNGPVSLMYHAITPGTSQPDWPWALSFKKFCGQLTLLQDHGWSTLCANRLYVDLRTLPAKSVLITFDDGYADNYQAFEELAKRDMKATWFVVTQDIGKMSSWIDEGVPSSTLLTESQLLEMRDAGMEIGSHTLTHCRLTQVSQQQMEHETSESKKFLSNLLNQPITAFAYPYGLYNQDIINAVQNAGYKTAFTTRTGFGLVNHNPLEVRRISIMASDSLATFARKLAFADNSVGWKKMTHYSFSRIKDRLKRQ